MLRLSESDREYFTKVARAAYTNPFGEERAALDDELSGSSRALTRNEMLEELRARIAKRLARLEPKGSLDPKEYVAEDRELLESTFLFDTYYAFFRHCDELIQEQLLAGSTPRRVTWANDALAHLRRRGLSNEVSLRYFSIYYQLRRAFFFIDQALVGTSPCMQQLRFALWNSVFTCDARWYKDHLWDRMEDFSTLILGETGTGKGTAAAAIGRSCFIPFKPRTSSFAYSFTDSFFGMNLSQFPETLIESELFGHRKGAFTGATDHHDGVLSRCRVNGTIFLDEIGDLSVPVQIKLLQVLQERTYTPVGGHEPNRFEGRVIAATHRSLDALRQEGRFRDDFYYRLCTDVISVPPLRQRIQEDRAELGLLVDAILRRTLGEASPTLSRKIHDSLVSHVGWNYAWPGNVRELEQAIRRILLTGAYTGDQAGLGQDLADQLANSVREGTLTAQELLTGYCRLIHQREGTFEAVAKRTELDRRTAKKYVEMHASP